ncbi:MAG: hypothetical protein AAFX99_25995, partial [Myxococcota bacterium]
MLTSWHRTALGVAFILGLNLVLGCFGGSSGGSDAGDASLDRDTGAADTGVADVALDVPDVPMDATVDAAVDSAGVDVPEDTLVDVVEDTAVSVDTSEDAAVDTDTSEDAALDTGSDDAAVDTGSDDTGVEDDRTSPVWDDGAEVELVQVGRRAFQVRWPEARDDRGVVAYAVTANGSEVRVVETQARLGGFAPGQVVSVEVRAEDAAGNVGEALGLGVTLGALPPDPADVAPTVVREGATFAERVLHALARIIHPILDLRG